MHPLSTSWLDRRTSANRFPRFGKPHPKRHRHVNPYSAPSEIPGNSKAFGEDGEPRSGQESVQRATFLRIALPYADAATATFALAMFGLAIPLNAYVMLQYSAAFNFQNPVLITAVRCLFPWLTMILAIGIPVLIFYNRRRKFERLKTVATVSLMVGTIFSGVLVFLIVSMPVVTWLRQV